LIFWLQSNFGVGQNIKRDRCALIWLTPGSVAANDD